MTFAKEKMRLICKAGCLRETVSLEDIALWPQSEARVCHSTTAADCKTYVRIVREGRNGSGNGIEPEPPVVTTETAIMIAASAGAGVVVVALIITIIMMCIK